MKKTLSLILALIMTVVLFAGCVEKKSAATPDEYFEFTLLDDGTYEIKAKNTENLPENVVIPEEHDGKPVTSIGRRAFFGRSGLTSVTIPDSVTSIGNNAFLGCSGLTSVTMPGGVTSIGGGAFDRCNSLTSITIPDSVTSIKAGAFPYCSSLTSIDVDGKNKYYTSFEGVLFNKDKTVLIACPGAKTDYTVPDGVTSIGDYAFNGCSDLTSVTIPGSVTSIGNGAFSGCSSLTSVTIPDGITEIGKNAFRSCRSLTSVTMPDSVTLISDGAFSGCENLKNIAYKGTISQWYSISKGEDWKEKIGNYTVHCTDGDIEK